jgi:flagellar basal-body rod protein FlgB
MPSLGSVTTDAYASALDAYSARQMATANNIANVNTPNFIAGRVTFEDALAKGIADGNGQVAPTNTFSREPARHNGNNVNTDSETISNIDTVLRFQFASQAISSKLTGPITALRG